MTNKSNATITRTFIGHNVTAQVTHISATGDAVIMTRTVYVGGSKVTDAALKKAFAPDSVAVIKATEKVSKLYGISEEDFMQYGVVLPDRVEYPSVKARREAREKAGK